MVCRWALSTASLTAVAAATLVDFTVVTPIVSASPDANHHFWQLVWSDVTQPQVPTCCVVLGLSGVLCSAAGIGGGGIYVTVLMLLGYLSPTDAIPLSKAIVLLGSVSSLVLNLGKAQSNPTNSLIDWSIIRLVVPTALLGTLLGVLLNWSTPGWGIVLLLTLLLAFMTVVVLLKAHEQYLEEPARKSKVDEPEDDEDEVEEHAELLPRAATYEPPPACLGRPGSGPLVEGAGPRRRDVVAAFSVLAVVIVAGIARHHTALCRADVSTCDHPVLTVLYGGSARQVLNTRILATTLQVLIIVVPTVACVSISAYASVMVANAGWHKTRIATFQLMALVTGVLSALVGVGGGLIFAPFFLASGLHPGTAVATSATCVLFTSSSSTFQYYFSDRINLALALTYGAVNCVASWAGTSLVHALQEKCSGRRYYITLIVAAGVSISAALSGKKLWDIVSSPPEASSLMETFITTREIN